MHATPRTAMLAATLLLPVLTYGAGHQATPYTYQGTVHAFSAKARTLDLITGVGLALRLVHLTTPAKSGEFKVGEVVRVYSHRATSGLVADSITRIEVSKP